MPILGTDSPRAPPPHFCLPLIAKLILLRKRVNVTTDYTTTCVENFRRYGPAESDQIGLD